MNASKRIGSILRKTGESIRTNTLVGIVLITPVVATILIFRFLLGLATDWMPRLFPDVSGSWLQMPLKLVLLLVILSVFYLAGLFARNVVGQRLYRLSDRILTALPLVKGIYIAVRSGHGIGM